MSRCDPRQLRALLSEEGLSFTETGLSYKFTCPLCKKPDRLYMYKETGVFKCMKCGVTEGFRGAPEFALKELTGRHLSELRLYLYGTAQVQASKTLVANFDFLTEDEEDIVEEDEVLPHVDWPYYCLTLDRPGAAPGVAYLQKRGVPVDIAMEYDIRYSPQDRSVVFPVWMGDCLVGWQTRTIDKLRVLTPGGVKERIKTLSQGELSGHRERVVMFANRVQDKDHAVICEGPVSALKAHYVGGNVATMGKEISAGQIGTLLRCGISKVYLAIDPDAMASIDPILEKVGDVPAFLVEVPNGPDGRQRDLGDCSFEEASELVLGAKPVKRGRMYSNFKSARLASKPWLS